MSWTNTQILAVSTLALFTLTFINDRRNNHQSTYGRYSQTSSDVFLQRPIGARLGWFIMEVPNLILCAVVPFVAVPPESTHVATNHVVFGLFVLHYLLRTFTFSVLIKGGKPFPLEIALYGVVFTSLNGYVQSYHHLAEARYAETYATQPVRLLGLAIFFFGMFMNHWSDAKLRGLRKSDEDKEYKIPRGGFFEIWSAPNLVGEIIEWWGYCLFAGTIVSAGFAMSTMMMVGNRAIGHHQWYQKKFEDYPKNRCALLPGVY